MMYGQAPKDLGLIDLSPSEMMFWLYCPIKLPNGFEAVPDNLEQFNDILIAVYDDCEERWNDSYVYISAKTMHVSPTSIGNRPGWHCDGFMTDDLNYVWYDYNPTEFYVSKLVSLTQDHTKSIEEMEALAAGDPYGITTYPLKHLLRLDEKVIHRVGPNPAPSVRTFVKVSVSYEKYALKGNSVNHLLDTNWVYEDRMAERNCPRGK
jgi:hypothetical protein